MVVAAGAYFVLSFLADDPAVLLPILSLSLSPSRPGVPRKPLSLASVRMHAECYLGRGFMAVFNNKTAEFRRRAGMTKPSITENFINEPIPEDKAAAPCAAVRKSTAVPRSLRLLLKCAAGRQRPTISSPSLCVRAI